MLDAVASDSGSRRMISMIALASSMQEPALQTLYFVQGFIKPTQVEEEVTQACEM